MWWARNGSLCSKVVSVNRSILTALVLLGGTVVSPGKAIIICSAAWPQYIFFVFFLSWWPWACKSHTKKWPLTASLRELSLLEWRETLYAHYAGRNRQFRTVSRFPLAQFQAFLLPLTKISKTPYSITRKMPLMRLKLWFSDPFQTKHPLPPTKKK